MDQITVRNSTKANLIGARIDLANTFASRLFGLLGKRLLECGRGVLIQPSCGIHTFGMWFAIDVVALDKDCRVLRTWSNLAPFRISGLSMRTHSCLELAAGQVKACNIETGDRLDIVRNGVCNVVCNDPASDQG